MMVDEAEEKGEILTLAEYLQKEAQLEKEALSVLPGKFDKCSYSEGYIRQHAFVCTACTKKEGLTEPTVAIICYACSIACHSQCELIDLGPRRNTRCDCGNFWFISILQGPCSLAKLKDQSNPENKRLEKVLHNFAGRFCSCDATFDADTEVSDMLQCLICEDWFHENCLPNLQEPDSFTDFICTSCTCKYPFLRALSALETLQPSEVEIDVLEDKPQGQYPVICLSDPQPAASTEQALFLPDEWRGCLCSCAHCKSLLEEHQLQFIAKVEPLYEPEEDQDVSTQQNEIAALDAIPARDSVLNGIKAMDNLKDHLVKFLEPFKKNKKVVTRRDIDCFFSSLQHDIRKNR